VGAGGDGILPVHHRLLHHRIDHRWRRDGVARDLVIRLKVGAAGGPKDGGAVGGARAYVAVGAVGEHKQPRQRDQPRPRAHSRHRPAHRLLFSSFGISFRISRSTSASGRGPASAGLAGGWVKATPDRLGDTMSAPSGARLTVSLPCDMPTTKTALPRFSK